MNREEFGPMFGDLCAYHGRKLNKTVLERWYYRLRTRRYEDVQKAMEQGMDAHRAMPTLDEVCSYLPRYSDFDGAPGGVKAKIMTPKEEALARDAWPHFAEFMRDIHTLRGQPKFDACVRWMMTYKGLCMKHGAMGGFKQDWWDKWIAERDSAIRRPPERPAAAAGIVSGAD